MAHQLLLADDSVTIQRVIKLTFADEDVEVVTVGDGNLAVASIDRQPPDIVLADVAMPGRSGYEVAQHIRTSPKLAHIPVLLLTGAFEPVDEARASEVGCDGVLAKPFEPEVVVSRVKELLAKPRTATPVPAAAPIAFPLPTPAPSASTAASQPAAPLFPAPVPPAAPAKSAADVDAYFERLDQAFATLALSPRSTPAAPVPPPAAEPEAAAMPPALMEAFAGLATPAATPAEPAIAPATEPVPPAPALSWASAPAATAASTAATPATVPGIAGAALNDAQVQQIVDRVVEALTARLGVNLADVVSTVAERIVRDEIAQIKKRV